MLQVSGEQCAAACRRKPQARHSRRGTARVRNSIPNSAAWHSGALRGLCEGVSRCLDCENPPFRAAAKSSLLPFRANIDIFNLPFRADLCSQPTAIFARGDPLRGSPLAFSSGQQEIYLFTEGRAIKGHLMRKAENGDGLSHPHQCRIFL